MSIACAVDDDELTVTSSRAPIGFVGAASLAPTGGHRSRSCVQQHASTYINIRQHVSNHTELNNGVRCTVASTAQFDALVDGELRDLSTRCSFVSVGAPLRPIDESSVHMLPIIGNRPVVPETSVCCGELSSVYTGSMIGILACVPEAV